MWYWDLEVIICNSNTCVILHNFIVRMKQNSAFRDEAAVTDIFMEFHQKEILINMQSRTELDNNITQLETQMCDKVDEEAHRITEFTDQALFVSLRTELICPDQ